MRRLATIFFLVLAAAGGARAADPVAISVTSLGAGEPFAARRGVWLPLEVAIENKGPAVEGVLRCRRGGAGAGSPIVYERRVSIAAQTKRVEHVLFFPREGRGALEVTLLAAAALDAPPLARAAGTWAEGEGAVVLAVSRDASAFRFVAGLELGGVAREPVAARALRPEELPPAAEGLELVQAIFVANADMRGLTPAQGEALRGYVEAGGQLVLAFSGNANEYRGTEIDSLLPCTIAGAAAREVGLLATFGDEPGPRGEAPPLVVAEVEPVAGAQVLLRDGDRPLAVRRRVGAGSVTYVALDPTRRHGKVSQALAAWLVSGREPGRARAPLADPEPDPVFAELAGIAARGETVQTPSFFIVGGVLALYIALVVPLNYRFWKRRGRLERTAPTAAGLALAFGGAIYGVGLAFKGSTGLTKEATLLEVAAGESSGRATAACGVFAPERRLARLEARLAAAPAPARAGATSSGARAERGAAIVRLDGGGAGGPGDGAGGGPARTLEQVELDQWALRLFALSGAAAAPCVQADLALAAGTVRGTIAAPPDTALSGAVILLGPYAARIGDLAAGERKTVAANLELPKEPELREMGRALEIAEPIPFFEVLRERMLPGATSEGALEGALVARAGSPPARPWLATDFLAPRRAPVAIVRVAVPVRVERGLVELPAGIVRPRTMSADPGALVIADVATAGTVHLANPRVYQLLKGSATIEWTLPCRAGFDLQMLDLDLSLERTETAGAAFTEQNPRDLTLKLVGPGGGEVELESIAGGKGRVGSRSLAKAYDPRTGAIRLVIENAGKDGFWFCEPWIAIRGRLP